MKHRNIKLTCGRRARRRCRKYSCDYYKKTFSDTVDGNDGDCCEYKPFKNNELNT